METIKKVAEVLGMPDDVTVYEHTIAAFWKVDGIQVALIVMKGIETELAN